MSEKAEKADKAEQPVKPPKVKSILISLPAPPDGKSPYDDLKEKYKVQIAFRPFTQVEPVGPKEFRRDKVDVLAHTAVILTSRAAIEQLIRLMQEMRLELPADMKYFCVSEAIALYLQKFINYRKRKVFYPKSKEQSFEDILLKHKTENYLFVCSNVSQNEILDFMQKHKLKYSEAVMYKTVSADLSDLENVYYDVIAFFNPTGIKSLFENFPDFKQNNTRLAAFGSTTKEAILEAGLTLNIEAPTPQAPSMKMALEEYIKRVNKG